MRQQALQEEQKETQQQQQQILRCTESSTPISVSPSCRPPAQVPVEVLKVRVGAEGAAGWGCSVRDRHVNKINQLKVNTEVFMSGTEVKILHYL